MIDRNNFIKALETLKGTITKGSYTRMSAEQAMKFIDNGLELLKENRAGAYECFHCGQRSVIWGADFSMEDYGYEEEGIVHELHCENCGAEITYVIPNNPD